MELMYELYKDMPRQGPGSNESTEKAFRLLQPAIDNPQILDMGCGSGIQTVELARLSKGFVIGLDNYLPFLERLRIRAGEAGLSGNVDVVHGSMSDSGFDPGSFDIIWAEGSIYIIGFENGLNQWRHFLKPGGYMAVTEISWLRDNPPDEIREYWEMQYPAMKTIEENAAVIRTSGYDEIGHFVLPEQDWLRYYYEPLEKTVAAFRMQYKNNADAQAICDETEVEIAMYRTYSDWYGYVFYVMKKTVDT